MKLIPSSPLGNRLLVSLVSWILLGCSPEDPPPRGDTFHVVVLGSSTAAGAGPAHPLQAWAARYEHFLQQQSGEFRLTNLAQPGYLSYQLMPTGFLPPAGRPWPDPKHNLTRALQLRPDALLINLPSNDTDAGYSLPEQLDNLRYLAQQAQKRGVAVWVTTTQPREFHPDKVRLQEQLRDSISVHFGERSIDFWSGLGDCAGWPLPEYNAGDGVHLNAAAHQIFFERVKAKPIFPRAE